MARRQHNASSSWEGVFRLLSNPQLSFSGSVNLTKDDYNALATDTTTVTLFLIDGTNQWYEWTIDNPDGYIVNLICQWPNTINWPTLTRFESRFPWVIKRKASASNVFTITVIDTFTDPKKFIYFKDDFQNITVDWNKTFITANGGTNTTVFYNYPWFVGAAQHNTWINPALWRCWRWLSNTAIAPLATQRTIYEIWFAVGILPTALQAYIARLWLIDNNAWESFNACYLRISETSPNFVCVNRAANSSQTFTTSVPIVQWQPYIWRVEASLSWSRHFLWQYWSPLTEIANLTAPANIPTGNLIPWLLMAKTLWTTQAFIITDSFIYIKPALR